MAGVGSGGAFEGTGPQGEVQLRGGALRLGAGAATAAGAGQRPERAEWIQTVEARGFQALRLPHFYRTVGWLWRRKERIEQHLYERGRHLFNAGLDVVFFDTTSTYFEGRGWEGWAKLGKSRDQRPDHLQLLLGVVMRRDGVPVTCEIWPGNLNDMRTVVPMLEGLKQRFRVRSGAGV